MYFLDKRRSAEIKEGENRYKHELNALAVIHFKIVTNSEGGYRDKELYLIIQLLYAEITTSLAQECWIKREREDRSLSNKPTRPHNPYPTSPPPNIED